MDYKNRFVVKKRTPKSLVEPALPLPEFTEAQAAKMDALLVMLQDLHERKYSTLHINEKRLVELFCKRIYLGSSGAEVKEEEEWSYTALTMNAYAHTFAVSVLGKYFQRPQFPVFHVIEDEKMDFNRLYGESFPYSGDPFIDALESFPTRYLPIRNSQGKAKIRAIWVGSKGTGARTNPKMFTYKNRATVTVNEAKYVSPYLNEDTPVEPTKVEKPKANFDQYTMSLEMEICTPRAAAIYDVFARDPESFNNKFGELPKPTEHFLSQLEAVNRDLPAYQEELAKFS